MPGRGPPFPRTIVHGVEEQYLTLRPQPSTPQYGIERHCQCQRRKSCLDPRNDCFRDGHLPSDQHSEADNEEEDQDVASEYSRSKYQDAGGAGGIAVDPEGVRVHDRYQGKGIGEGTGSVKREMELTGGDKEEIPSPERTTTVTTAAAFIVSQAEVPIGRRR